MIKIKCKKCNNDITDKISESILKEDFLNCIRECPVCKSCVSLSANGLRFTEASSKEEEEEEAKPGHLLCIIGKSGSGKSTLQNALIEIGVGARVISATTRPRRKGEIDGYHYLFMSDETYNKNTFEISTELYGYRYGISVKDIQYTLDKGTNLIFVIDEEGIRKLFSHGIKADIINCVCSKETSIIRLSRTRKDTTEKEILQRVRDDESRTQGHQELCSDPLCVSWLNINTEEKTVKQITDMLLEDYVRS